MKADRLLVVSNRLPVSLKQDDGDWRASPSSGGLVSAMDPVLRETGGIWIGWPGVTEEIPRLDDVLGAATKDSGYRIVPVTLSDEERDEFYYGYSNEVIWPLFHDLQTLCNFDPIYWHTYKAVNSRYAHAIAENYDPGDFVWVHDYQLICVAEAARGLGVRARLAFFLHIPFPSLDIFQKLPQQQRLLNALLEYDLIGFQTARDERNFVQCVRRMMPGLDIRYQHHRHFIQKENREIIIGSFPIGIDSESYRRQAASDDVARRAQELQRNFGNAQILLGVDRLDYTKGIPDRIQALRNALERYPELVEKVTLVQVVVPSRTDIPRYHDLKQRIDRLVGEINGQFSTPSWLPVHYVYRSLEFEDLLAHYRAAQIALITPHKDGMNLVAKEYCACNIDQQGVLILSRFAGAADQLRRHAILVNPYDLEESADAIFTAYKMPARERRTRMQRMQRVVQREDIFWWVRAFLEAAQPPK